MGYRILDCMIDFAGLLFVIAHLLLAAYFEIDKVDLSNEREREKGRVARPRRKDKITQFI